MNEESELCHASSRLDLRLTTRTERSNGTWDEHHGDRAVPLFIGSDVMYYTGVNPSRGSKADAASSLNTGWHIPGIFFNVGVMTSTSDFEFLASGFHVDVNALYHAYTWQLWSFGIAGFIFIFLQYLLAIPSDLRHLPRVSPYATIWSYARRESVDRRVKRLILPFAERGDGVVLVYMLGKWGVHVLDANVRPL